MKAPPARVEAGPKGPSAPVGTAATPQEALKASHTVLVIDVSHSMSTRDCQEGDAPRNPHDFRNAAPFKQHAQACLKTRQDAVHSSLFEGFIRPQLAAGAGAADVVSLITFASDASVSFTGVPFHQATEALRKHQPKT